MAEKLEASAFETDLVWVALRIAAETAAQFSELLPVGTRCHPLPFFGSLESATVITFGLNPSTHEFRPKRNWDDVTEDRLADQLVNYFRNDERSSHPWFRPWSIILSELGLPYCSSAAHIDLSSRATNSRKGELGPLFAGMLEADAPVWIEALSRAPNCKLVLAAGSVTKEYYLNEFISKMLSQRGVRLKGNWRRNGGSGQTVSQVLCLPSGREIPFFFCSTGPTIRDGSVLIDACRANMDVIREHLGGPPSARSAAL